jgi:hypothetical protein
MYKVGCFKVGCFKSSLCHLLFVTRAKTGARAKAHMLIFWSDHSTRSTATAPILLFYFRLYFFISKR